VRSALRSAPEKGRRTWWIEKDGLPHHHGSQRRFERASDTDFAGGGLSPRRTDRAREPIDRSSVAKYHRPARDCKHDAVPPDPVGTLKIQPRIAGDMAFMRGVAKHLLEASETAPDPIDWRFIERYTAGFESYQTLLKNTSWEEIELQSGVQRAHIQVFGEVYRQARSAIISWCLGVTQQEHAVDTTKEIINVLLMRGNIGSRRRGAVPGSRPLECARQSHLRHRSPPGRELAGPPASSR
jgi:Molybdopterin oxidoreductase